MHRRRRDPARLGFSSTAPPALPALAPPERMQADSAPARRPEQALKTLIDGNQRFVSGHSIAPDRTAERLAEVAKGQSPFAVILGCADSRVPPEIVFDQGLGSLFVIRIAGNFLADEVIGSIEYAVAHFATPLIMVLGHQRCGAVQATVEALQTGAESPGQIASIIEAIVPSVLRVEGQPGDIVENAVRANIGLAAARLRAAPPIITGALAAAALKVVGAYYHLDTGAVELLDS